MRKWTDDARRWLATYAGHSFLKPRFARPAQGGKGNKANAIGRAIFHQRHSSPGIRDDSGALQTKNERVDAILLDSRRDIWTCDPDLGSAGATILDAYFQCN